MWSSPLTDSIKGKPDIEQVDLTTRLCINDMLMYNKRIYDGDTEENPNIFNSL